ncbi:MAG: glycosyltransferase family 4 protein [Candidatus Sumerlaeia bacterium]
MDARTGGPLVRVMAVSERLRADGWEAVMALPPGGDFHEHFRAGGYRWHEVAMSGPRSPKNIPGNLVWAFSFPFAVLRLMKIIRQENPTIVHLHGLMSLQGGIAARLMKRKIVWHLSSCLYPQKLARLVMRFIRRAAHRMVIISESIREYHFGSDQSDDDRIFVIPEAVDTDLFDPANWAGSDALALRREYGIDTEAPLVGTIGNINPIKDYETFIRAAEGVHREIPTAHFAAAGAILDTQVGYLQKLKAMIHERGLDGHFHFTNKLLPGRMPLFLKAIDVFAFTSKAEGGPRVTLEAMSMARPVVSTRVGDVPFQVDQGETGYVVGVGDADILARHIVDLLQDADRRNDMGAKARQKCRRDFGLDAFVGRHAAIYNQLLADAQSLNS